VTRQELELGRAGLTRGYARNFETADQVARGAARLALYGLPDDNFTTFVPTVLALTRVGHHRGRPTPPPSRPARHRRRGRSRRGGRSGRGRAGQLVDVANGA